MLVTKNPRQMTMEENIRWLLDSHQELDARVFGADGFMLPEIREKLLFRAHVLIDGCLKDYSWLQIDDIILFGSAVTYEYQEFSDLDLLVKVSLNPNAHIHASQGALAYFIRKMHIYFLQVVGSFHIGKRSVEVKPVFFVKPIAQYSVRDNKWLIKPKHRNKKDVNSEAVLAKAKDIVSSFKYYCNEKFDRPNGKFSLYDINEMRKYYNQTLDIFHGDISDWVTYKLVDYTGEIHRFRRFYTQQAANTLSF